MILGVRGSEGRGGEDYYTACIVYIQCVCVCAHADIGCKQASDATVSLAYCNSGEWDSRGPFPEMGKRAQASTTDRLTDRQTGGGTLTTRHNFQ